MSVNFCNADFVKSITCSVCECDGYSVNNLISKSEFERRKGFLADYFIKPPITIEIQFACDIQLSNVILWTQVGRQKSIGIELFSTCSVESTFQSIGYALMKNDEAGFLFIKRGGKIVEDIDSRNFLIQYFKSSNFLQTRKLQIKIFKTLNSSVPALQKLEIWGEIHKSCPKETKDIILNAWENIRNSEVSHCTDIVSTAIKKNMPCMTAKGHCDLSDSSNFEIPDDYLDPISCEIMTTPMILPSGKIIDSSTLEKFNREEAKWGRLPSDPFTGKTFTEINRPRICIALKTRIDKFLLNNCDESYCKNLPRTVGDSRPIDKPKVSSILSDVGNGNRLNASSFSSSSTNDISLDLKFGTSFTNTVESNKKRKFPDSADDNVKVKSVTDNGVSNGLDLQLSKLSSDSNRNKLSKCNLGFKKYDELKKQSLECLLKTTLSNLPSFSKNSSPQDNRIVCFKCNSASILYELPCKHFVCRHCLSTLIENSSGICVVCSTTFRTCDPKRIHLTDH